jgi:hypothetical protein
VNDDRKTPASTLSKTTDTAVAMALLWAIPAIAFVFMLARL